MNKSTISFHNHLMDSKRFVHFGNVTEETFRRPKLEAGELTCSDIDFDNRPQGMYLSTQNGENSSIWSTQHPSWNKEKMTVYTLNKDARIYVVNNTTLKEFMRDYTIYDPIETHYRTEMRHDAIGLEVDRLCREIEKYPQEMIDKLSTRKPRAKNYTMDMIIPKKIKMSSLEYIMKQLDSCVYSIMNMEHYYKRSMHCMFDALSKRYDGIYFDQELFDNDKIDNYIKRLGCDTLIIWNWCIN